MLLFNDQLFAVSRGFEPVHLGCWADSSSRVIEGGKGDIERGTNTNPVEECYYFAKERGWEVFAVEDGAGNFLTYLSISMVRIPQCLSYTRYK